MYLKLKYLTCPKCKGHSYSSYYYNDQNVNVICSCKHEYKTVFEYKDVKYPDVIILGETFKNLDKEREIFYDETNNNAPFGVNVTIEFHKESHYINQQTRYNATEFHYLHESYNDYKSVAIESEIHYTGGTLDVSQIKSIVITKATKKHKNY